jgi:predicted phosphodiesterase
MKIGLLSDIHEDIISLKKGFDILFRKRCDQIICLGDITGFSNPYYPFGETRDANSCIEMVRKYCTTVLSGNHDLFSAGRITTFKAGIEYPGDWFNLEIKDRFGLLGGKIWLYEKEIIPELTVENLNYLRSLPEFHIMEADGFNILFSHFLYPDISGSLRKRIDDISDYRSHFMFMRQNNCILSFGGHMHKEGFEIVNNTGCREFGFKKRIIKRTGSFIGLPSVARGRNSNGVAIFDTESFTLETIRLK